MNYLLIIFLYSLICYIHYRVVAKFDLETHYGENLIPLWNTYLLARQVMTRPGFYLLFQVAASFLIVIAMPSLTCSPAQPQTDFHELLIVSKILAGIAYGYLWSLVAQALGKRRWLHFVLAFLGIPLIVTIPLMAFDKSRPIEQQA